MTKVDIFSGFLGSGKTTLIRKLIDESFKDEKIVLIENEFGEINIDSGFLKDAGVEITELSSGCICCTLVGDFGEALKKVVSEFTPDRILIEPSGVGKLSDVIRAVQTISETEDIILNSFVAVADAKKCKMYIKNFGEFYLDQIEHAKTIVLSRTQDLSEEKLADTVKLLREHNPEVRIITTPWENLSGNEILEAMEGDKSFAEKVLEQIKNEPVHEHHHEHGEHGHHHEHDHDCDCHNHGHEEHGHHHEHEHDCDCHNHGHHHEHNHEHHHHEHDSESCCHDHDHDADEIFDSWGIETLHKYSQSDLEEALSSLDYGLYGVVLRAKGIVQGNEDKWWHFDYVPGELQIREGSAGYTGQLCIIGSELKTDKLAKLFHI